MRDGFRQLENEHLVNVSLDYDVSGIGNLYLRAHNLFEGDRPVMNFSTPRTYRGYLGSDERRIYLGLRRSF